MDAVLELDEAVANIQVLLDTKETTPVEAEQAVHDLERKFEVAKSRLLGFTLDECTPKFKCKRCGGDTATKQADLQGWDGVCSNCGMIGQNEVGERVRGG